MKAIAVILRVVVGLVLASLSASASAEWVTGHWIGDPVCSPQPADPAKTRCNVENLGAPTLSGMTNDRFFFYYTFRNGQTLKLGDHAVLLQRLRFTKTPPAAVQVNADFAIALTDRDGNRLTDFVGLVGMRCYDYNTESCSLTWQVDDPVLSGASVAGVVLRANMRADATIPILLEHGEPLCTLCPPQGGPCTLCPPNLGALTFEADSAAVVSPNGAFDKLTRVPDVDGNGWPEIAAMRSIDDQIASVDIRDMLDKEQVGQLSFDGGGLHALDIAGLSDLSGNGAAEVAALFRADDGRGLVQVRDGRTGASIGQWVFAGSAWQVQSVIALDANGDGRDDIGVLAVADSGTAAGVQIRDLASGAQLVWIGLPMNADTRYLAVDALPDLDHNGFPEVAALRLRSSGKFDVIVKDSRTKQMLAKVPFGDPGMTAIGIAAVNDLNGNGRPEVAVLFKAPNGRGIAQLRDAYSGAWLREIRFVGQLWDVRSVTSQDADLDGVTELSVLAVRDDGSAVGVQVKDTVTGDQLRWIGFPTN